MQSYRVGVIIGSLSSTSINRKLATALCRLAPQELRMEEIPFRDLPIYSPDYDKDYPPVATAWKEAIAAKDAILFVTPEYNRSIPGGLKSHRLGDPSVRHQQFHPQAGGGDRDLAGRDRNRDRAAAPAQPARILQRAADELAGSLHPVQARARRRPG